MLSLLLPLAIAAAAPPRQVAIVCDERPAMEVLARFLDRNGCRCTLYDQPAYRRALPHLKPDAVIMYVHSALEEDVEKAMIAYTEQGGRLVLLHHAIASARVRNKHWLPFLGISLYPGDPGPFAWKVAVGDVQVVNLAPGHYITTHGVTYPAKVIYTPSDGPSAEQELPAINLPNTEAFPNQVFTDGRRKTVLLGFKVTADGKTIMQDRAGWTLPAGKGQVVYLQQGHRPEDFENPAFAQIVLNAVEWLRK